jgi:exosome complex RNA-binding protein Rrp4
MKRHALKLTSLTQAIALATVLSTASLSAFAADIPLSEAVIADQITTKVVSVDAANHQVVLEGPEGRQVPIQLTDKAKNLDKLKVGDLVKIDVISSVAAYLDTDVDKGLPGTVERTGEMRAAPGSAKPAGEAYRQVTGSVENHPHRSEEKPGDFREPGRSIEDSRC